MSENLADMIRQHETEGENNVDLNTDPVQTDVTAEENGNTADATQTEATDPTETTEEEVTEEEVAEETFEIGTNCKCAAATSITLGAEVKIKSGATVIFKAPNINIEPGFHAEPGAVVRMKQ